MRYRLFAFLMILVSFGSVASSGALRFSEINLKDGLSQATVLDMIQDNQGYMWFATQDGLNRYDGYDFVVYRQEEGNPNSLSENYVSNVFQDSNGFLWLTTRNGLNRFDPRTNVFNQYYYDRQDPYSIASNWTFSVNEDHLGHIWVGSDENGLSVYNPNTKRFVNYQNVKSDPNSLSGNSIYDIFIDRTGVIWVATRDAGVSRFNKEQNNFTRFQHDPNNPDSIGSDSVYSIFQHSDGTLWFATRGGGLNRFDQKNQRFVRYQHDPNDPQSISSNEVWSIAEDRNGDLLVGTLTQGLNRLTMGSRKFLRIAHDPAAKNGLSGDSVMSSYVDDTGIVWFGIRDVGLNLLNQQTAAFKHYRNVPSDEQSLNDNSVQGFVQTQNGKILVGTRGAGISWFDPDTEIFTPLHQPGNKSTELLGKAVNQIMQDAQGNIWLGTKSDGLVKYEINTNKVTNYRHKATEPDSISSNTVIGLVAGPEGKIWLGTRKGLNLFDPTTGKVQRFIHNSDDNTAIGSNWVTFLMVDHENQLWVGHQKGLDLFNSQEGTFIHFTRDAQDPSSLSGSSVMSMFEDSKNNLWVSTNSGLNKFNREQGNFARYRKKQGLSNNQVYGVLEDNDGFLWIITNYGLNRYDPDTGTVKLYTEQNGLQNNELSAAAFYKLSDGQLMVGGVNGFNLFDPRKIKTNPFPPKVMITNFRVSNQPVPVGLFKYKKTEEVLLQKSINFTKQINLSHEESVFSFEFAALHYSAPTLNQFQYRLLGFDSNWTDTDYKNRRATYTNLAAGKYMFEIKAANKDGVWSPDATTIALTIRPPWWLTKTAKFVWLALFFITVNVAYRLKTNQIRKQKTELQLQVSRQVAQVVQQKRALETSYNDIKVLSSIGQRINSSLDLEKVLWAVYEDINKLMDGTIFGIGLYQSNENRIKIKLAMEKGNRYKPYYRSMEDKNQFPVWCIENDEVVFVNDLELDGRRYLQQHEYDDPQGSSVPLENGGFSQMPQSFIYVPMRSAGKVLGFLAVQSFQKHAYQDVHIDILKTLSTYTGTAIVNAKEHQELLDSRKELIESEKMASLGALTAGVAHEINNPTNFVHVSAQNLEVDLERFQEYVIELAGDDADEAILMDFRQQFAPLYGHIATIQDGTDRIKTIVHDLRAFTHLDAVNKRNVSITENILSTIHLVQTQFSEITDFITEFNDDPQLLCYPSQLNQVYMNLIVNACDAIRDKQTLQGNKEKGKIIIGCRSLIDNVEITIQDNGNGMSEATKKRLFEPFYTTKDVGKGSGLGLSISYGIVKKHDGQLTANAQEGVGTTFRLLLPYQTKPANPQAQQVEDDDEVLNIE